MPLIPTPYDEGFSDGEKGLPYRVPQGYTVQEEKQYQKGYNQGVDYYRKKAYEKMRRPSSSPVPYIDDSWIPKNGGYGS